MDKVKSFLKGIFYIFLYFILGTFLYTIFYNHAYNTSNLLLSNLTTIFIELLLLFIFIIIFRKVLIPDFYDFKKNFKSIFKDNFKVYLLGLLLMIVTNIIIMQFIDYLPTNEINNRESLSIFTVSSIFSMIICAPIIEELITRVHFKKAFPNKYLFLIFSSLLFGSLHFLFTFKLSELIYILPYASLGLSLSYIYYKTDNIFSSIFFHSLHNLICVVVILVGV